MKVAETINFMITKAKKSKNFCYSPTITIISVTNSIIPIP